MQVTLAFFTKLQVTLAFCESSCFTRAPLQALLRFKGFGQTFRQTFFVNLICAFIALQIELPAG